MWTVTAYLSLLTRIFSLTPRDCPRSRFTVIRRHIGASSKTFNNNVNNNNNKVAANHHTKLIVYLNAGCRFNGSRAILSGPAGGVVGYALTTYNVKTGQPVIGFDMGGQRMIANS